jgi:hypothetical protein
MKKKWILLPIILILSQCQIKVETKSVNAQAKNWPTYNIDNGLPYGYNGQATLNVTVYDWDGIEYRIFTTNGYDGKGVAVVNHTKELLEVELLKKQLKEYNGTKTSDHN